MKKIILKTSALLALFVSIASCNDTEDKADIRIIVNDAPPQINVPITGPDITNFKQFPSRNLKASPTPFIFSSNTAAQDNLLNSQIMVNGANIKVDDYLRSTATVAFLVIKNDQIMGY